MPAPRASTSLLHRGPVQLPTSNKPCQLSVSLPVHWRQQGSRMRWVGRDVCCVPNSTVQRKTLRVREQIKESGMVQRP